MDRLVDRTVSLLGVALILSLIAGFRDAGAAPISVQTRFSSGFGGILPGNNTEVVNGPETSHAEREGEGAFTLNPGRSSPIAEANSLPRRPPRSQRR